MPDDAANPLLDWLTEDARSFTEIARSWSKAADELPAVMMNELISAFWRGDFERNGDSSVFALLQPDSPHFDRRPGNYATRADGIVKVGADLRSYVTAERRRAMIFRREVGEVLCWREWDGTDDGLLGLAMIPFERWPKDMQQSHYEHWRMRRDEFAKWYPLTTLAAEAKLEQFWPNLQGRRSAPPKLVESRRKGDSSKVEAAVNAAYPSGIPISLSTADIIREIQPHLKRIGGKTPTDRTLRTHIAKMPRNPNS